MARPIDEKIVAMRMDDSDFKRKAKDTLKSFGELNKGLNDAGDVDLSKLASGIATIESRFSASGVVIATVISKLTSSAMDLGKKLTGAVMDPLIEGGKKRALNIEQAKFQFQGLGMDVEATMESALAAVKGTAFGLDEAAVVASQFGATGMRAGEEMTSALRGISGVAAMTGSSYSDIGNIFTTVAGNGRLMGSELLRLSSRGVNAAATLAKSLNMTEQEVRSLVTKGKISFEIFANSMSETFGEHATRANETYAGSLSNVKAAISRIGAAIATPEFVNKRDIFNALTPKIDELAEALGPAIEAWNTFRRMGAENLIAMINKIDFSKFVELGGITNLVEAFWNVVNSGNNILGAITGAFNRVFQSSGNLSSIFVAMTAALRNLTGMFSLSENGANTLSMLFTGIFAIFSGLWTITKQLGSAISNLLPKFTIGGSGGGISGFVEAFANLAIAFQTSVEEGNKVTEFIDRLGSMFSNVGRLLMSFGNSIIEFFSFMGSGKLAENGPWNEDSKIVGWLHSVRDALASMMNFLGSLSLQPVGEAFVSFFTFIGNGFTTVVGWLKTLGTAIKDNLPDGNTLFAGGFVAGMVALTGIVFKLVWDIINAFKKISSFAEIGESINDVLGGVGDALKAFTMEVKSKMLMNIAVAVGVLAASLWVLSTLEPTQITSSLMGIVGSMTALIGALAIMTKYDLTGSGLSAVAQITGLAAAMVLMSGAMYILSKIDIPSLTAGVLALAGIMGTLSVAMIAMSKFGGPQLAASSAQFVAISVAVLLLVSAVKKISSIDSDSLKDGLKTLGLILLYLGAFLAVAGKSEFGASSALGVIGLATSILIMVQAIKQLGNMDVDILKQGLETIGYILVLIAGFSLITANTGLLASGAGLVLLAAALNMLLVPILALGNLSLPVLAKGLAAMAIALTAIGLASMLMTGMIASGAGLMLVAVALNLLLVPIMALSIIPWQALAVGIGALAAGILLIGGAAALLGLAAVPMLLGAAGILALGVAMLAAGAGMSLFGTGLVALAGLSGTAITTIVAMLGTLIMGLMSLIPKLSEFLGKLTVSVMDIFQEYTPVILDKVYALIISIVNVFTDRAPQLMEAVANLITAMLDALGVHVPRIIDAYATAAVDIITGFINTIAEQGPRITESVANLMVTMIEALATTVEEYGPRFSDAFKRLMSAIALIMVDAGVTMIKVLFGWIPGINSAADAIGESAERSIREALDTESIANDKGSDFANTLAGTSGDAELAGAIVAGGAEDGASSADLGYVGEDHGADFTVGLVSKSSAANTAGVIVAESGKEGAASVDLDETGMNFGLGFAGGIGGAVSMDTVTSAAASLASAAYFAIKDWLIIKSPSQKAHVLGTDTGQGLANGMVAMGPEVYKAGETLALNAMNGMNNGLKMIGPMPAVAGQALSIDFSKALNKGVKKGAEDAGKKAPFDFAAALARSVGTDSKTKKAGKKAGKKTGSTAGKAASQAFNDAMSEASHKFKMGTFSTEEYIAELERIKKIHAKQPDQIRKVESEIQQAREDSKKKKEQAVSEEFSKFKEDLDERKYYNKLSIKEEYDAWMKIQEKYEKGTNRRKEVDREIYRLKNALVKEEFGNFKSDLDEKKYYNELSIKEELEAWRTAQSKYKEGTDERKEADREVYRLENELVKEGFNDFKSALDDRKYYNEISIKEELEAWEGAQKKYKENSEERKQADREVYRLKKELIREEFELSKSILEDRKYYNDLSLTEELSAWEKIRAKYKEGTDERKEADREVYRLKNDLNRKMIDINDTYVAKIKEANAKMLADSKSFNDDRVKQSKDATDRMIDEERRLNDELENAIKDKTKSIANSFGLFEEVGLKPVSGEQLLANLKGQEEAVADWQKDINSLAGRGLDSELMDELREMGPKSASEIKALNSLTDAQLAEYSNVWRNKYSMARVEANKQLEGKKQDTYRKIEELRAQTAIQLEEINSEYERKMEELREQTQEQMELYNKEWMEKIEELSKGTKDEFVKLTDEMPTIGVNVVKGMMDGMKAMEGPLMEQARAMAQAVADTIASALDMHSPSRVTRKQGNNTGEGFMLGIGDMISSVKAKSKELALTARDTINEFIDGFELPAEDNELHFKAVISYDEFDPKGFGEVGNVKMRPDTSFINRMIASTKPLPQVNSDSNSMSNDNSRKYSPTIQVSSGPSGKEIAREVDRTMRRQAFEMGV